ncbi:MAG: hypothetical protein FD170_577 [Bacteroidetes bacterium]|nr:MAG: hypothetical protein FD170_577 [Bacteroidota bacterium]
MLKSAILRLAMLAILFAAVSCATVKVEKPAETYLPEIVRPESSVIGFTAEARLSDIQKELNRQFTGLVYEDNSLDNNGGDNLMVKAWKQGDIALTMKENVIIYRVPLRLWIKAGFKTTQLGITLSDYREVSGALALMFRTSLTLNPDWTLSTKTETTGYEWITEPVVKIAGINVPVKFVADLILQKNLKTISSSIDESVKEYLDLKPHALQAWKSLNQPISLNDEYKVWLSIETSGFFSSPITASNGIIRIQSGVKSVIETSIGQKPAAKAPGPLPALQISNTVQDGIVVNASLDIPFEEINVQASTYLVGMDFSQGKRKIKVEEVKIYGSKGKLVAETRLSGSFKGTIYFSGIPAFNAKDSTLFLKDFDYDISTRNLLVKSAAWLYQGGFRNMMAKEMVWPMASDIKMMYGEINNTLKSYPLADGVTLRGQVSRLSMNDILITPSGVKPFISGEGRIDVKFSIKN